MTTASRKSRHSIWFWVVLAAIAVAIGFMLFSPTFKGWVEKVAEWAEGIMRAHPVGAAAVFFVLTAVSAMLTFASSAILVPRQRGLRKARHLPSPVGRLDGGIHRRVRHRAFREE